jgi:hypothetical protein
VADNSDTINISDEDILSLWQNAQPSTTQDRYMTFQTGPYDDDCPTFTLRRLVELSVQYAKERITILAAPDNGKRGE